MIILRCDRHGSATSAELTRTSKSWANLRWSPSWMQSPWPP